MIAGVELLRGEGDNTPSKRLDAFLTDWSRGADASAARLTDQPTRAVAALRANRAGLDGATLRATQAGDVTETGEGRASASVRISWDVPEIGTFAYTTRVGLRDMPDDGWAVAWAPTVVHPQLRPGARLGTVRTTQQRGRILDRNGAPLVQEEPVKRVGAVAGDGDDPATVAQAIGSAVGIDPRPFEQQLSSARRGQFVEAITLRPADYDAISGTITAIPGVKVLDATAELAPTRSFGRQVLGDVRELTAEQLRRLGPGYDVGDIGGQWGLEAAYQGQLAGRPRRAVVIRVNGVPRRTLMTVRGRRAADLRTTLDANDQAAAEQALGDSDAKAALVAVEPSTGNVLAVANRPIDESFDRALEGRYPPGSTFKIVTTDALLTQGLTRPDATVDCPTTVNVGGRAFKNFEAEGNGEETFADAFAQSCNTAFVQFANRLDAGSLPQAGRAFGLGSRPDLPVPAYGGQVPEPRDVAATAAAMIGQDRVLASPLGMAGVIAAVADGSWRPPRLVADEPRARGTPLTPAVVDQLRDLTRQVITSGTGTALAGLAGEPHGKSGTAEYGNADPPATHAWFVAYRDDIAVAVLLERGTSGGTDAAPIADAFFNAIDAGVTPDTLAASSPSDLSATDATTPTTTTDDTSDTTDTAG